MNGPHLSLCALITLSGLTGALSTNASAALAFYEQNLVYNPSAEVGAYSEFGENLVVPGWEDGSRPGNRVASNVNTAGTQQAYGMFAAEAPVMDHGDHGHGRAYFYSGGTMWNNDVIAETMTDARPNYALSQTINVANVQQLDGAGFSFRAEFGGWSDSNSSGWVDARFLDNHGGLISRQTIGGVRADERRNNSSVWVSREMSDSIPEGTKFIEIGIWYDNFPASCSCITTSEAGVDNVHFELLNPGPIPEPTVAVMSGIALAGLLRRRRQ